MAVNNVNNTYSSMSGDQLADASRVVSKELDKDAFLRLLLAELANQDPLNPMDDREFIAQMAQFSTLEQMTNMTKALEGMSSLQQYSTVSYVGKVIAFQHEDADGQKKSAIAQVLAVWFDPKNGVMLETELYGDIPLKEIEGVGLPTAAAAS